MIRFTLSGGKLLQFRISPSAYTFKAEPARLIYIDGQPYEGPYTVVPKPWEDQVLATNEMHMTDDVTVKEIPYAEVSNTQGITVTIGG